MREMTAGIIIRDGKVLLVHNIKHGLRVEPPGGKKEAGEGWEGSVAREIREELGVEVEVHGVIGEYATDSPEGEFLVRLFVCEITSGEPALMEPDKIGAFGWYSISDMREAASRGDLVPNMVKALPDIQRLVEGRKGRRAPGNGA